MDSSEIRKAVINADDFGHETRGKRQRGQISRISSEHQSGKRGARIETLKS
jgi:hypothetical protein